MYILETKKYLKSIQVSTLGTRKKKQLKSKVIRRKEIILEPKSIKLKQKINTEN